MADDTIRQALDLHRAGRLDEAEHHYLHILAGNPGDPNALHLLGVLCRQTGRLERALDLIGQAAALLPEVPEVHCNLGNALADAGRTDEARARFRQALALDPGFQPARLALGEADLQSRMEREYRQGRWDYLARSVFEMPRHGVVAAYIRFASPGGAILDLGCGEGTLFHHLDPANRNGYMGLDLSTTALERARARGVTGDLVCADLEEFHPPRMFPVIAFNEVLLYVADPGATIRRYRRWLKAEQILVVSWFQVSGPLAGRGELLAAELASARWRILDRTILTNPSGPLTWEVTMATPAGAA